MDDRGPMLTRVEKSLMRAKEDMIKKNAKTDPAFYTSNLSLSDLPNPMAMNFIELTMGSAGKARVMDVIEKQRTGYYERLDCRDDEEKIYDKQTRIARCKPKKEAVDKRAAILERMGDDANSENSNLSHREKNVTKSLYSRYKRNKARCEHLNKISPGDHELVINHLYQASCVANGAFGDFNCDMKKNAKLTKLINIGGVNICVDPELYDQMSGNISGLRRDTNRISENDMKSLAELIRLFNSMESVYKENAEDILTIIRNKRRLNAVIKYTEDKVNPFTRKIRTTIQDKDDSYLRLLANGMYLGLRTSFPDFFSDKFGDTPEYYKTMFGVNLSDLSKNVAASRGVNPDAVMSGAGRKTRHRTVRRF